jgi:hypothetical protein
MTTDNLIYARRCAEHVVGELNDRDAVAILDREAALCIVTASLVAARVDAQVTIDKLRAQIDRLTAAPENPS